MKSKLLALAGLLLLITGCAAMFGTSYKYDLAVMNTGKYDVWCSLVASSKGMAHEIGIVIPGASKTFAGPFKLSYADNWTVTWTPANGKKITKTLDLTDKFPKRFEGRLVFTIDADNNLNYKTE